HARQPRERPGRRGQEDAPLPRRSRVRSNVPRAVARAASSLGTELINDSDLADSADSSPVEKGSAPASLDPRRRRAPDPGVIARKSYERGYRDALLYQADLLFGRVRGNDRRGHRHST